MTLTPTVSLRGLFASLFFLALAGGLFGQASLSVQGVLTKSDGTAVDDNTYSVTFKLWTAAAGGTAVHTETINTETTGGVYSVVLGTNGTPITAPFNQVYYLGVSVGGGQELNPRPLLTHAPYALSLLGQNNQFPSTGTVTADAFKTPGGAPAGGVAGKGYSFSNGGDQDGGLFSLGDDNVAIYANGTKKIQVTNGLNELFGNTNTENVFAYGYLHSNGGLHLHNNGTGVGTGVDLADNLVAIRTNGNDRLLAWNDNKNYYRATGGHVFDVGNVSMLTSLSVNGTIAAGSGTKTRSLYGVTFYTPGGVDDTDSGLFGPSDGEVQIKSNGNARIIIGANGTNYFTATNGYFTYGLRDIGDNKNVQWNQSTGELGWDNSSRRFKENIQPFVDDFRLILKAQPKIYTRKKYPGGKPELGYIAEEMDSLGLSRLVEFDKDGKVEGYNYEKMILYVVEVLKMQDVAIAKLQADLAAAQGEKGQLAAENASLQKQQAEFTAQLGEISKRMKSLENAGTNRK